MPRDPLADVTFDLHALSPRVRVEYVSKAHIAAVLDDEEKRWTSPASLPARHAVAHLRTSLLGKEMDPYNPQPKESQMPESEYQAGYRRAIEAVEVAVCNGLIIVPGEEHKEDRHLRVAEHFMVALGVNEP